MNELNLPKWQANDQLEYVEDEEQLFKSLDDMAKEIGWIIIRFNSLEGVISYCIAELISHDPLQDERVNVFLSEMQYNGISRALIHLYGQFISDPLEGKFLTELSSLEKSLTECGKRRNEYAHAEWTGIREGNYVCVKTQAKKIGIFERFKKYDVEKIREDINFIIETIEELENFHESINDALLA
mgnify:CR=1 FL=1